jgi:YfiR/HmsC-like
VSPALQISREALRPRRWPSPTGRARAGLLLVLTLLALSAPRATAAEPAVSKEYQLKAAFLYNFTKFVEWPAARFADATSPIVVAVVGRNPFGEELENVVKGRAVNGRAITVKVVTSPEEASAAHPHLLFVPAGEETRLPVRALQLDAVVAVGESEAFAALGGMITFVQVGGKVRFEIDIAAAERGHVKISAQLLKLATVVRRRTEEKP